MSHTTKLRPDGSIVAIHNGDWSGDTLIRGIGVVAEVRMPSDVLDALVAARSGDAPEPAPACPRCEDRGYVMTAPPGLGGSNSPHAYAEPCVCRTCTVCGGGGFDDDERCRTCRGTGAFTEAQWEALRADLAGDPKEARGASTTSGSLLGDAIRQQLTAIGANADFVLDAVQTGTVDTNTVIDALTDIAKAVRNATPLTQQQDRDAAQHAASREALAGALARLRETEGRLAATEEANAKLRRERDDARTEARRLWGLLIAAGFTAALAAWDES